jgi:hypothetical protein
VTFFIGFGWLTAGQTSYMSNKLAEIADKLPRGCFVDGKSMVECPSVIKDRKIVIRYSNPQTVSHIGVSLFNDKMKELANPIVCDFIERAMLELLLQPSAKETIEKMKEYNIAIRRNGVDFGSSYFKSLPSALEAIRPDTPFSLKKTQKQYIAEWKTNGDVSISVSFPSDRELITGTNKKEADETLNSDLLKYKCSRNISLDTVYSGYGLKLIPDENIYEKQGQYYHSESINSNVYYSKETDSIFYVLDSKDYPVASISNLFQGQISGANIKLDLNHKGYGKIQSQVTISLKDFICFFKDDYDFYCAVQEKGEDNIDITLVLYHKDLNYIHMLTVKSTTDRVMAKNGALKADFYSNISHNNLNS